MKVSGVASLSILNTQSSHFFLPFAKSDPNSQSPGDPYCGCHSNRMYLLPVRRLIVCVLEQHVQSDRETSAELEISILPADPERSKLVVTQNVTGVLFEDHIAAERFYVKLRLSVAITADLELVGRCVEQLRFHQQGKSWRPAWPSPKIWFPVDPRLTDVKSCIPVKVRCALESISL